MPSKETWKTTVSKAINTHWNAKLREECLSKSTLEYLNKDILAIGSIHPIWHSCDNNVQDVRRVITKVRFLTGTYIVQSKLSRFNQNRIDPTCQLCHAYTETYQHMLLECGALLTYRKEYLKDLANYFKTNCGPNIWTGITKETLMDIIIDISRANSIHSFHLNKDQCIHIERITRYMCHRIHTGRLYLLEKTVRGKKGRSAGDAQHPL